MQKNNEFGEEENNYITLNLDEEQEGTIKVHSQILNDLSSGIYSSSASCLKELVNNSYDANAENVIIRILPDLDTITIVDDGDGMNAKEFDKKFAWISKSDKRKTGEYSRLKRPLIGKIGIGFIAVNEICEKMEVISTKKGEDFKFTALIDFKEILDNKKHEDKIIKAPFKLVNTLEDLDAHYTIIKLLNIKNEARPVLESKLVKDKLAKKGGKEKTLWDFKDFKQILEYLHNENISTIEKESPYIRFMIDLASYIPIEYVENAPIENVKDDIIKSIVEYHKKLNFKVDIDGIVLKKPIYFPDYDDVPSDYYSFKDMIKCENGDVIKFKGYFYCQKFAIKPTEFNGVSLKIKNIPIAHRYGFDNTFLGYPTNLNQILRHWISGEIYIESGMEDAMKIDRTSFRETHPHFVAFQNYLHNLLDKKVLGDMALTLYETEKEKRNENEKDKYIKIKSKLFGKPNITIKVPNQNIKDSKKTTNTLPSNIIFTKKPEEIGEKPRNFKTKDWEYLEMVFLIFEKSIEESNNDIYKLKKIFYKKINDWLKEKNKK